MNKGYSNEIVVEAADFLKSKFPGEVKIGIICGSGLSSLGDDVEDKVVVKYEEIPNFPKSTVDSHRGQMVFGELGGKTVMCMQGRFHPYEGYEPWQVCLPIRVMKLLGVQTVIITNAAGGLNRSYKAGDFMIVKDHVSLPSLVGYNPLWGPNDDTFGPRFVPVSQAYDRKLRALMHEAAKSVGYGDCIHEGIYCNVGGPSFETIWEMQIMLKMGCDAVGMSTSQEIISVAHCGMKACVVSLITDYCIIDYDTEEAADPEAIIALGKKRAIDMRKLITEFIQTLQE